VMKKSREACSSQSEAPFELYCQHLHSPPHDMTPHLHLISLTLKRKSATMDTRALREPSIVDWSSLLPSQESVVDSVVPDVCHLALAAARELPAALREDGQNGSTLATIPDGLAAVELVETWPRFVLLEPPRHVARSDLPARCKRY